MSYDIIGDIHGQCQKLEALLRTLGYRESGGAWRHPSRQVIFVGDFVDRGPEQVRTVTTVRRMVEAGVAQAVMGNHELNAIAWHTPDPASPGEFLRPRFHPERGPKNRALHRMFLAEVEAHPNLHAELIDWFLSLPLWLDLPNLRVVHACWHQRFIEWLSPVLRDGRWLTRELMPAAVTEPDDFAAKDTPTPSVFKAVECLTKGVEVPLPHGRTFVDKDGLTRDRVRIRWWDTDAATHRSAALLSAQECASLPDSPLPDHVRLGVQGTPLFFGHYWLPGMPTLESSRYACLDYRAGTGTGLVAYRFDGEPQLQPERLVWVD